MKLSSFRIDGRDTYGVVKGGGLIDLGRYLPHKSILELLRSRGVNSAAEVAQSESPDFALDEVQFQIPISNGEKIICIGINYPEREEEYRGQTKRGNYPNLFVKFPSSFSGHDQPIVRPKVSDQFDYEGEIVLVIGREGRHIPVDQALDHVGAITAGDEGSVRDWLNHSTRNVTQGKNFFKSGSMGPWMVTPDEIDPRKDIHVTTRVNGEIRQHDSSWNTFWHFDELISYISTFTPLFPGDIIFTGTPVGAGVHRDPPVYLRPGDILEVEVEGVGILRNSVIDED